MAKILMLASEATPFASTGGLAEVLQGLPIALAQAGHEVAVLLPFYQRVRASSATPTRYTLELTLGPHNFVAHVHQSTVHGVLYLFLDIPALYDRPSLYGDAYGDYTDNHLRFGALCRGAVALCQSLFLPQLIHCHDWQTGLLPVLLREAADSNPTLAHIKTVVTIHNCAFQGRFPRKAAADLGLTHYGLEPDGSVNFLRAGVIAADAVTTVSPTYAREIQTDTAGCGLEGILQARRRDLHGIVNGIDFDVWNPATDSYLPAHFSAADLTGKHACKLALLQYFGLGPARAYKPLIGVVARLTPQKGLNLLMRAPSQFLNLDASLVLLGSGDADQEDFFRSLAVAHPNQVAVEIGYTAPRPPHPRRSRPVSHAQPLRTLRSHPALRHALRHASLGVHHRWPE